MQGLHDEQMNSQKLKELDLCSERASFREHITSAGLSMSVGQTEVV